VAVNVEELYRRYGPMVLRRCRRLLRDEEKALDAMQDTFVQVLRYEERLVGDGTSSLLFRIATNVCLNKIRGDRRRPEDPDDELLVRIAESSESSGANPVARLFLDKVFQRELDSTRTIAVLHLLDGMTLEEVATEVGLSVSGVRKRLRTLRARLEELEGV
jgi:RNA polymerase sigma-70 factor (ECF subfamily)